MHLNLEVWSGRKQWDYSAFFVITPGLPIKSSLHHIAFDDFMAFWPFRIFHNYIYCTMWRNDVRDVKCVFWFFLQLVSKHFCILGRIQWDVTKLESTGHENPSSGSRVIARWWADKLDKAKSRFIQLYECAWKWDMLYEQYTISASLRAVQQHSLYWGVRQ